MLLKKIIFILVLLLSYQNQLYSKSNSLKDFNSNYLSKYFSGIVAFENKDNSTALNFFNYTKILMNTHDPYLKRYTYSLVLENKVVQAINVIKTNKDKENSNFFDANLLLVIDSLKKNNFKQANFYLGKTIKFSEQNRLNLAILESLKEYIYLFTFIDALRISSLDI